MIPLSPLQTRNALVLSGAVLAAAPFGAGAVASVALGGAMQIINLGGLERSVAALVGLAVSGNAAGRALIAGRWLLFLGAVFVALLALPIEPLAFLVGLSTVVPAVLWHGWATDWSAPADAGATGDRTMEP
jgi:hypothetical protein